MNLYLVRHGNTFDKGDTVTRVGGRTDLPLSTSGQQQVKDLAQHFESQGITFAHAYCSPLQRTQQTAKRLIASENIEIQEFLRELDYGPDENQPEDQVIARIGATALKLWETEAIPPEGWQVNQQQIVKSWQDFLQRCRQQFKKSDNILVVTSNGIARFALQAVSDTRKDIKLKTGAYGIFTLQGGTFTCTTWNTRPQQKETKGT